MAKVAIFDEEQVKTFEFDEDTDVDLKYLTKEEARELNKAVEKIVNRTGADWSVVWNQKLGEEVVKGWRHRKNADHPGFTLPDGTPIPFTPENRDMMMKHCREFSLFVGENTVNAKEFLNRAVGKQKTKNS